MRTKWTLEKCLEIAKKYNSFKEFSSNHNDAVCAARRNGWSEEVFKHLSKKDTKWKLLSAVIEEAKKYNSINEFRKNSKGAYESCKKNKWDSEVFSHMIKKTGFWNDIDQCKREAKKYTNRKDFMRKSSGAYGAVLRNGWLDEVCKDMPPSNKTWTKSEIIEEAKKYSSKGEFSKMNKGAYLFALRRGWKDEVCKEMNPLLMTWTKEKCFEVIKTCKSKTEFSRNFGSAAQYAKRNGFYEELVSGMAIKGNLFNRMIYAYEFKDKHVYIGLTYKESKRKNEHLERGPVAEHSKKTNSKPKYKSLTSYIDVKEAQIKEAYFIKKYADDGWILLNKSSAGALGGNKRIWTKNECRKVVKLFNTVKELMESEKYNTVYQAIRKNKWQDELFTDLKRKTYWTEEKCLVEAKKYSSRTHFMRNAGGAYNYARAHNILNKVLNQIK